MTYSPDQIADGQRLTHLLDTLERDLAELRRMLDVCEEAQTMPGRNRPDMEREGTDRQAAHGPSRPTETIALDHARERLNAQKIYGVAYVAHAVACVRGVTAGLDRALSYWEGEDPVMTNSGGVHEGADGPAGDS